MSALTTGRATGPTARAPLIGRQYELAELVGGLEAAGAGRGRLFLLSGDAGAGKTRLAEALVEAAEPTATRVRWATCAEGDAAPPFWPWSRILRAEAADLDDEQTTLAPGVVAHLARLVPELARRSVGPGTGNPAADLTGARIAFFDAVTAFLHERSRPGGLVLVLDDLHAADEASLRLLQFVARDLSSAPVVVVGTYREALVRRSPARHRIISALARHGRRMTVTGLDEDAVAALLERTTGCVPVGELARQVHHAADGNPFFVEEMGRLLASEGAVAHTGDGSQPPLPEDVHVLIGKRLETIDPDVRQALSVASVLGHHIDAAVLAAVLGRPVGAVLEVLSEGQRLDLVEAVAVGRFQFSHSLVREVLYEPLRPSERVSLHRRTGEVLAQRDEVDTTEQVARLAHHFYCAARGGNGEEAVRWCTAAGDHASAALAFEEAASSYGRALEALALSPPVDERHRYDLLVAMARAQRGAGEMAPARQTYEQALKSARTLAAPELLVRAVIDATDVAEPALHTSRATAVDEALAALPPGDSPLRARLLVRLAHRLRMQRLATPEVRRRTQDRVLELGRGALAMARRVGEPDTLRAVLWEWHFTLSDAPEAVDERLAVADELVQLATAGGDGQGLVQARLWRAFDRFVAGDAAAMSTDLDDAGRQAEALHMPFAVWAAGVQRGALALLHGRLDEAEGHARQAVVAGGRAEVHDVDAVFTTQLGEILRHRGEWLELEDLLRTRLDGAAAQHPEGCVTTRLAIAAGHRGRRDDARRMLDDRKAHIPDQATTASWCCTVNLCELAWLLDATDAAEALLDRLAPLAGRHLVVGVANASLGAADRYVGQVMTLLGRFDEAEAGFQAAHRLHARLGSPLWDAYTFADQARMLVRRGDHGDRERARELAEAASRGFGTLGMTYHQRAIDELFAKPVRAPSAPPAVAPADEARLSQDGEYWAFEYAGQVALLRDSKGLRYLAHLLRTPGREHHALDLVVGDGAGGGAGEGRRATRHREPELVDASGDGGAVLDAQAKAAYRARLAELRDEVDDATGHNDRGRAERAQAEMDFLLTELAGAIGLGGRDRRAGSDAERARQSVTRAVKGAIERLTDAHPALGEHLRSTVRTGIYSTYAPDPRAPITWNG